MPHRRPSKKHRTIISCLLLVTLCGFSLGLREASAVSPYPAADGFRYYVLSRADFPMLYGTILKQGQFASFVKAAEPAFPIPALAEGFVPQGMAYSEELGWFVLAYYFPERARPSLLALVDAATGEWVKQVYLLRPNGTPYTGHAGGAAAWGEHVWVTSGGVAYRLAADDLRQAEDRGTVRFRDIFRVGTRGSIATAADGVLWVGDFYNAGRDPDYFELQEDPSSGNFAWMAGFTLCENAPMGVKGLQRSGDSPAPFAVLSIPHRAQGLTLATTGELLLSTSLTTRRPSSLWVFPNLRGILAQPPAYEVAIGQHTAPLWVISEDMATYRQALAPMSEGIAQYNGEIYVLFESAALMYRERAVLFADYVFKVAEEKIMAREIEDAAGREEKDFD